MTADDTYRAVFDHALRLLKFRARSRAELRDRLSRKCFPSADVERAIARLVALKFIDDAALARQAAGARRRANQGDHRIRRELRRRGLAAAEVEAALAEEEPDAGTDADRAWAALERRAVRVKGLDPRTARRRLEGYLFRQGFDAEDVRAALRRYFKDQGDEG